VRDEGVQGQGFAVGLVLGGIVSVQIGAAFATTMFDEVGPAGSVLLRIAFAALLLLAIWRPAGPRGTRLLSRDVVLFGIALAGMNLSFYASLDRIPLGIAVTLEFVGPLAVAILRSRRRRDLIWVGLAAAGLLLLSPVPGSGLDTLGAGLALLAGGFWGVYIILSARVGAVIPGGAGLAVAMAIAAVLVAPVGIVDGAGELLDPSVLAVGLLVGILSSALPYSLELEALRRLPQGVFGVMMSLEPAVAALAGFIGLNQDLAAREVVAIGLVLAASAGALGSARGAPPPEA
jgi:inner membrane transporter RhtA